MGRKKGGANKPKPMILKKEKGVERLPMEKQYQYLKDAPLDEYPSRIRDIYQQMY